MSSCQPPCHCQASAHTGLAIRNPLCTALSSHAPVGGGLLDAPLLHTPCQKTCHREGAPRPWGAIRAPPVADEAGKSPKRCLRQNKRGDFEEVPRLAATTVAANRLARQWPPIGWHDGGPEPVAAVKIGGVRRKAARKYYIIATTRPGRGNSHLPPFHRPALPMSSCQPPCHCEVSAHTGCGNP